MMGSPISRADLARQFSAPLDGRCATVRFDQARLSATLSQGDSDGLGPIRDYSLKLEYSAKNFKTGLRAGPPKWLVRAPDGQIAKTDIIYTKEDRI